MKTFTTNVFARKKTPKLKLKPSIIIVAVTNTSKGYMFFKVEK